MADSAFKDWPLALIRSEVRDTLAMRIYEARCAWVRDRSDWSAMTAKAREDYRQLAQRVLEGRVA